jgi:hypothetical protein
MNRYIQILNSIRSRSTFHNFVMVIDELTKAANNVLLAKYDQNRREKSCIAFSNREECQSRTRHSKSWLHTNPP